MQTVNVDIGPDGSVQIDAVGFTGADCEKATAFLEAALGQVTARRKKPEYRQPCRPGARQTLSARGG